MGDEDQLTTSEKITIGCHALPSQPWQWCLRPSACQLNFHPHDSIPCLYSQQRRYSDFPFQILSHFHTSSFWHISCRIFHLFFFAHRSCMGFSSAWILLSHEILVTSLILSSVLTHHNRFLSLLYKVYFYPWFRETSHIGGRQKERARRWERELWNAVF